MECHESLRHLDQAEGSRFALRHGFLSLERLVDASEGFQRDPKYATNTAKYICPLGNALLGWSLAYKKRSRFEAQSWPVICGR